MKYVNIIYIEIVQNTPTKIRINTKRKRHFYPETQQET